MRILIAEDDFIGRKLLQKFLMQYGRCDVAVNGREAIDSFLTAHREGKPYRLICLDIMMPVLDGIEVLKTIRDIEKQKGITKGEQVRIIVTTALNDRRTLLQTEEAGCEAYACKPLDLVKLREVMERLGLLDGT
jgi:two-component system, chemotaxis family, chemotaxis protein CheY